MISGSSITKPRQLLLLVLLAIGLPARADLSLEELLEQFTHSSAEDAVFREEKRLALLETPLVLEGTLSYRAPDYLRKEVLTPDHSAFEIRGDSLHIESGDGRRTLSLDSHPLLRAFAESYRSVLSGNAVVLQRHFAAELSGTLDDWSLRLQPRDAQVRDYITSISLEGTRAHILTSNILETSGDTSLMTITPGDD